MELGNHVNIEQFLLEFFGYSGRDFGNPQRAYCNNPQYILQFVKECNIEKRPAFISVQPMSGPSKPLGIEKLFFDFDYGKNSEIIPEKEAQERKNELKKEVMLFLKEIYGLNIKPLIVKTRRGYHVHIYFDKIYLLDRQKDFWKKVYDKVEQKFLCGNSLIYVDKSVIGDINRLCRIPLSIHEKSGEECFVVDEKLERDKLRSIEYFKLYGLKEADLKHVINEVLHDEKRNKSRRGKENSLETKNYAFKRITGIRPCFEKAMDVGEMVHAQRLALLHEAFCTGYQEPEDLVDIFRCFNDFNESKTRYQVNWFFNNEIVKGEIRPYSCNTINEKGWCLGDNCPHFK